MSDYILQMDGIHKSFPGVHALSGVQLSVQPGTVHGVMGENGAGKSTLMKIAIGLYRPDAGTIRLRGQAGDLRKRARCPHAGHCNDPPGDEPSPVHDRGAEHLPRSGDEEPPRPDRPPRHGPGGRGDPGGAEDQPEAPPGHGTAQRGADAARGDRGRPSRARRT